MTSDRTGSASEQETRTEGPGRTARAALPDRPDRPPDAPSSSSSSLLLGRRPDRRCCVLNSALSEGAFKLDDLQKRDQEPHRRGAGAPAGRRRLLRPRRPPAPCPRTRHGPRRRPGLPATATAPCKGVPSRPADPVRAVRPATRRSAPRLRSRTTRPRPRSAQSAAPARPRAAQSPPRPPAGDGSVRAGNRRAAACPAPPGPRRPAPGGAPGPRRPPGPPPRSRPGPAARPAPSGSGSPRPRLRLVEPRADPGDDRLRRTAASRCRPSTRARTPPRPTQNRYGRTGPGRRARRASPTATAWPLATSDGRLRHHGRPARCSPASSLKIADGPEQAAALLAADPRPGPGERSSRSCGRRTRVCAT